METPNVLGIYRRLYKQKNTIIQINNLISKSNNQDDSITNYQLSPINYRRVELYELYIQQMHCQPIDPCVIKWLIKGKSKQKDSTTTGLE